MTEPNQVTCPVCGSPKNQPCTTVIVGGSEYHARRYEKARLYETTVARLERERATAITEAKRVRGMHRVTPLGGTDLDSYTLAVTCYSCKSKRGTECTWKRPTKLRFHKARTKRGREAMRRSEELDSE